MRAIIVAVSRQLLVLALLASCRAPVETRPNGSAELPPVPAYAESDLGRVPVIWVDSIPSRPGYTVLGQFNPLRREIWLWKGLVGRGEQWRVYGHEECHLRHWDRGVREYNETTEKLCDVYAFQRVASILHPRD